MTIAITITKANIYLFIYHYYLLMFIHFWERKTEHKQGRGTERKGDTESEAGSRLRAVRAEPDAGLEPTVPRDRDLAEVGRSTDCATQAPQEFK